MLNISAIHLREENMQFLVLGYDGKDGEALARRMAVREAHLSRLKENTEKGHILFASAILDEEGKMIGSMILCEYPTRTDLEEEWLNTEPYLQGKVWHQLQVHRAQIPAMFLEK
jgi:uncharacterized protein YciI